jgi:phosphoserine phosphatase RsbU/P
MNQERILLVDDEPAVLEALRLRLGRDYDIYTSSSPEEALELIIEKEPFPVIMSDLRMPYMNGIEFLQEAQKLSPQSSTILLTGQGEFDSAVEALNSGVIFKYLSKPCERVEIGNALAEGIKIFKRKSKNKIALKEHSKENEVASILQKHLVFSEVNFDDSIDFAVHASPQKSVSGDFYEIIPHKNNCYDVIIADVMGKGLSSAIIGAAVKNVLHQQVNNLVNKSRHERPSISSIIENVERVMFDQLTEANTYVTVFYLRVDLGNSRLSYISRGHPGAILLKEGRDEVYYFGGSNLPIGITPQTDQVERSIKADLGDKLILYSDGITDPLVTEDSWEPVELIVDCLEGNEKSSAEIINKVYSKVENMKVEKEDMTIMALTIKEMSLEKKYPSVRLSRHIDEVFRLNKYFSLSNIAVDDLFKIAGIEAFTNIIKHSKNSEGLVELQINLDSDNCVQLTFSYEGDSFAPDKIDLPDCQVQADGFGLYLLEKICSKVEYGTREDTMNFICLTAKKES